MHILLPPSETKRPGGGSVFDAASLAHDAALGDARMRVRDALVRLSGDEAAAVKALKLGVKNRDELARNLVLDTSGAMPAIERYTGVLYDALDAASLPPAARGWIERHVSVQSALFGLLRAGDEIPAYRLSGSSRLPSLGAPLPRVWAEAHASLDWEACSWVLDLRSKDYAALAPLPEGRGHRLHVVQRGAGGEVRALNHFNKAAKGDLVRRLAVSSQASLSAVSAVSAAPSLSAVPALSAVRSPAEIVGPEDLLRWAEAAGLELVAGEREDELTLVTALGAPKSAG